MTDDPQPRRALRFAYRAMLLAARLSRPMLLGVRAMVLDEAQRVFLVRHSYVPGWHFPGGGVEVGETLLTALIRELIEEGNIVLDAAPVLHGVFFNKKVANRDHVALYLVRAFHQTGPRQPDREIIEAGFFAADRLPAGTSTATHARLAEVFGDVPVSELW